MRFDRFTMKAQEAIASAQQLALARSHTVVTPLHLLHALLDEEEGVTAMVLKKIGSNLQRVRDMTESEVSRLPTGSADGQMIMPDPAFGQVILDAQNRADKMGDEYLSAEHLFLSLAAVDSNAKEILDLSSITPEQIQNALKDVRGGASITDQNPEEKYQALERYGIDLLEMHMALIAEVEETPRRCDEDIGLLTERFDLLTGGDAAQHHGRAQWQMTPIGAQAFVDLKRQFSRGGQNEGTNAPGTLRPLCV